MKPLVTELWLQFAEDPEFAASFAQVLVERVEFLRQSQRICVTLRSAAPLDRGLRQRLAVSLRPVFNDLEVTVYSCFNFNAITPAAVMDLIEELKEEGLPINGFLDRSRVDLKGDELTIHLRTGKNILAGIEFPKRLSERIEERTGVRVRVKMSLGKQPAAQEWEQHIQEKVPATAFVARKPVAQVMQIPGLDLTDKPVEVFHGKLFKPTQLQPLKDVGGEGGKVTIWGEVFATETKGN
ncbi:MAG: PolC-type DNA polymerase III, partial [Oscillospiraceae bacterium]|nr:PolC-type DNA polymerase III [Oscillospiraceae bacterium]